jgi:hypothetical protein
MARQVADIIDRSRSTILSDALGAAALVVILIGGLSLPAIV